MGNAKELIHRNRGASLSDTNDTVLTKASVWKFVRTEWRNILHLFLGLTIILIWSGSAFAQIAISGRYWQYNGQRELLLGGWNHGHNPFIDHDNDNDKDKQGVSSPEQIISAMDELAGAGGNYLRCVLDPGMAAGIQDFAFCAKTGTQYDLNSMTGPFWERLEMFISEAKKRDIIVQMEIWDRFDLIDGSWGS
jgi:hypothetical protein